MSTTRRRRAPRSPVFAAALEDWRECRAAYTEYLESHMNDAERACNGVLLNKRGRAQGVTPESLFLSNAARANAYASDELRDYWRNNPRVTFARFEKDWWHSS